MTSQDLRSLYCDRYKLIEAQHHDDGYRRCFYCGEPADTIDHVPPLSRVSDYESIGLVRDQYFLVSCCQRCNILLGSTLQDSLFDRLAELRSILLVRHRAQLNMPDWSESEIAELGVAMRDEVERGLREYNRIADALEYTGGEQALSDYLDTE